VSGDGFAARGAPAPRVPSVVAALIRKDLQLELRSREALPAMLLFTVSTFVLFHFGLDRATLAGDLAAGVLWVTLLFAAVLAMNRLFVAERDEGGFDGFLLAPVDRTALFLAKAVVLFCFLAVVEIVALPAFAVLLLGPSAWQAMPELLGVLFLADVGIAVVGTLVGALGIQTGAPDLIVPIITLPLLLPVVIGAAQATAPLLAADGADAIPVRWLASLGLYDMVFALIALAVFDFLLED
jgi:heme exporter protein B